MEALLDHNASFEKAISESIRDAWFESSWGGFTDLVTDTRKVSGRSQDVTQNERLAELFKERASQIIIETAFKKLAYPKLLVSLMMYSLFLLATTVWVVYETNQDRLAGPYLRKAVQNGLGKSEFIEIISIQDFWKWSREQFLDGVYPEDSFLGYYYKGENLTNTGYGFIYGSTKILGVPRWRQVRSQEIDCDPSNFDGTVAACFAQDMESYEDTSAFGPGLKWTWTSAGSANEWTFWGQYGNVPGSGFIVDFPAITNSSSRERASDLIEELMNGSWIDVKTRAVICEFPVYSPADNQFGWVQLLVEFPLVGSAIPSFEVSIDRLKRYFDSSDVFVWFLEIVVLISFILWSFHNGMKLWCFGYTYFKSFYSWFFILMCSLFLSAFCLHFYGFLLEKEVNWNATDSFVNLSRLKVLWMWERACLSLFVLLAWFNLFEYAPVLNSISRFVVMIEFIIATLGPFFVVFLVFISAFSTSMYVAYGYKTDASQTWTWSFFSRIDDSFGGSDFAEVRQYNRVLGVALQTAVFIIVVLILLNLFIAILGSAYDEASEAIGDEYFAKYQFILIHSFDALQNSYLELWHWFQSAVLRRAVATRPKPAVTTQDSEGDRSPANLRSPQSAAHILAKGLGKSRRSLINMDEKMSLPKRASTLEGRELELDQHTSSRSLLSRDAPPSLPRRPPPSARSLGKIMKTE
eukprot:TRINITY_DN3210_c1_g1_i1.p1 TRINITY_DN3210_c1_g1~~TRINITY_DN3210_c1_g1_i1.p1  ORF type:complete len:804 (-),score=179.16 TRINITY_DN3210_c1_g1_i1:73-2151(-)